MIKGLVFDFDGLIIDTERIIYQSWQELYRSYGCEVSLSDWVTIIGTTQAAFDPAVELERQVGHALDWSEIEPQRRRKELDLVEALPTLPGVTDILASAHRFGLKVGLASSSPCSWVTGHLQRLGLIQYFDCVIASDDVRRTKPDPELFLRALAELGLQPEEAVVFEDSPNGVLAAWRAGTFVVAVPSTMTRGLTFEGVDMCLESLTDMPLERLVERLQAESIRERS